MFTEVGAVSMYEAVGEQGRMSNRHDYMTIVLLDMLVKTMAVEPRKQLFLQISKGRCIQGSLKDNSAKSGIVARAVSGNKTLWF